MKSQILTATIASLASCTVATPAAQAAQRPNVVIIIVDDLGWGDVGYHGGKIATPNIDQFAKIGIELDRFYTSPVSTPTRAGVLTGRYPNRFGVREVVIPPWRKDGLDVTEQTLADMLGECGYENRAALGKWHLGHTYKEHYPLSRGFTHFYGHLNGAIDYFTHEREGELDWHRGWESDYTKGYSTDLITDEAVDCIESYSKESSPYFMYIAYNAPHSPFQAPEEEIYKLISEEKFKALNPKERDAYTYMAMVNILDRGIGEVMDAIKKSGEWEDTLILFMSDNGGVANIPKGSTSKPLRGNKFLEWDGGVRVPAIIHWGRGFKSGVKEDQLMGFVDIVPTIAEIVGYDKAPKPYDGVSVLSILDGSRESMPREIYLGCGAVVSQDFKYIKAGRNGKMKLTSDYLVSYESDPYEAKNAAAEFPDEVARLRSIAVEYDAIVPSVEEVPYDQGREGFKAPKEWRVE